MNAQWQAFIEWAWHINSWVAVIVVSLLFAWSLRQWQRIRADNRLERCLIKEYESTGLLAISLVDVLTAAYKVTREWSGHCAIDHECPLDDAEAIRVLLSDQRSYSLILWHPTSDQSMNHLALTTKEDLTKWLVTGLNKCPGFRQWPPLIKSQAILDVVELAFHQGLKNILEYHWALKKIEGSAAAEA